MRIVEDGVWRYYNCPDPVWRVKCRACREKVETILAPVRECLDCWKIEVWSRSPAVAGCRGVEDLPGFPPAFDFLVDSLLVRGIPVIAKASRAPILVVRSGIPGSAYPQEVVDHLLVIYAASISERDFLRREAEEALGSRYRSHRVLPVRRGCWKYDEILGPWQAWYPVDRDYEGP